MTLAHLPHVKDVYAAVAHNQTAWLVHDQGLTTLRLNSLNLLSNDTFYFEPGDVNLLSYNPSLLTLNFLTNVTNGYEIMVGTLPNQFSAITYQGNYPSEIHAHSSEINVFEWRFVTDLGESTLDVTSDVWHFETSR